MSALLIGIVMVIVVVDILLYMLYYHRKKVKQSLPIPVVTPLLEETEIPSPWERKRSLPLDRELDRVNAELTTLRQQEPVLAKMIKRLNPYLPREDPFLNRELQEVTNTLHGYPLPPRATILTVPEAKATWDERLAAVEKELSRLEEYTPPRGHVRSTIPSTYGHVRKVREEKELT